MPPTRSNSWSCRTRSSLVCRLSGMSPISSRKTVPPFAASNFPFFAWWAPVNAPFSWPNSSTLQQVLGQRHAVDHDKRLVPPRTPLVDRVGEDLLAGAALAEEQHGGIRAGRPLRRLDGRPDQRALSEDVRGPGRQRVAEEPIGIEELSPLQGAAHRNLQILRIEGLQNEINRPLLHGLDGGVDGSVRGDHDRGNVHALAVQGPEDFHAVHLRHLEIEQHDGR